MNKTAKAVGLILAVMVVVRLYGNSSLPLATEIKTYVG